MPVILCVAMIFGAYIKRFSPDFEEEDKSKLLVFLTALIIIGAVIGWLTNR